MHKSELPNPRERVTACMLRDALARGIRTPEDLLRNFDALQIMQALIDEPELRAQILEPAVGTRAKVALRKTADAAGIDLQLALEEGVTDAATIAEYFDIDDQVRFLDPEELWQHCTETRFWERVSGDEDFENARQHLLLLLEEAIHEELLGPRDVVAGITADRLMVELPPDTRVRILDACLSAGRAGMPFGDAELLGVVPLDQMAEHIPLAVFWHELLEDVLAPTGTPSQQGPEPKGGVRDSQPPLAVPPPLPKNSARKSGPLKSIGPQGVSTASAGRASGGAVLPAEFEEDEASEEIPLP